MTFTVEKQEKDICVDTLEPEKLYLSEISNSYYLLMTRKNKSVIYIPMECGGWLESHTKAVNFNKYYEITHMTLNVKEI